MFSAIENEVFRLEEAENIAKLSYKLQRNFVDSFGYLDLIRNFELDNKTKTALDAMLDY